MRGTTAILPTGDADIGPAGRDAITLPPALVAGLERALAGERRVILAVSGGLDSMALLHAAAAWRPAGLWLLVATFDHGTGAPARDAARLVRREAARSGLPVRSGRAPADAAATTEAAWRDARWRWLRELARRHDAVVATAHHRDDQLETVVLRLLRGTGVRGLAALAAGGHGAGRVLRPWLGVPRALLEAWVAQAAIPFVADPSNADLRHRRNRLRHELLPALTRAAPGLAPALLGLAERAAAWRRATDRVAERLVREESSGALVVARSALAAYSPEELATLWPAIAARGGVRLDQRGTRRLAAFTTVAGRVARVPLSGEAEVLVLPDRFVLRRRPASVPGPGALTDGTRLGPWCFHAGTIDDPGDPWRAVLPAAARLTVRSWRPGDRIRRMEGGTARRVKRFFSEAGVAGPLREGWPVVLADGEIVWIPGVCRGAAATARPGRPEVRYRCDRIRS